MPKCKNTACQKQASYGLEFKKPLYCTTHKEENMFIVTTHLCKGEDCKKYPHYNFQGESKGIYCIAHKKDNMKVVGTFCAETNCTNIALYNLKNRKRKYCFNHKTDKMVESGKPICKDSNCLTIATYGNKGEKPTFCFSHKENTMTDLFHNPCIFDG